MRRLKWIDVLLPLGLLAVAAALFAAGRLPGRPNYYALAGLALVVAHVILRWEAIAGLVGRRQLRHGGNAALLIVTVLAVLVGVNWVVNRYANRWDFSKDKLTALSEQSVKVVEGLKDNVKFVYFPNTQGIEAEEQTRVVRELLREYQARSSRITLQVIDATREPDKALAYGLKTLPTLILERGARQDRVVNTTEQDITNALIRMTRDTTRSVCFVKGEGERLADDSSERGFSGLKGALEGGSYTVSTVSLFGAAEQLGTCTVLVIGGPEADLSAEAVDSVRHFARQGGKVLLMMEPDFGTEYPNLTGLLREWNVQTAKDVLMEYGRTVRLTARGLEPIARPQVVIDSYPPHEITGRMDGYASAFWQARSVEGGTASVPGISVQGFLETSRDAWADKDLTFKAPNPSQGRRGPVPFGVAVTMKLAEPAAAPAPSPAPSPAAAPQTAAETRIVVVGDADFASNALLSAPGNRQLLMNTVAWLVKDTDLISIPPKSPGEQRLNVMLGSTRFWGMVAFSVLLVPGIFVVWGIVVWWRRR